MWLVISVFCFCVTVFVGVFFVTNYQEIMKIVQVATLIKMEYLEEVSYQQLLGGVVRGMVDSLSGPILCIWKKKNTRNLRSISREPSAESGWRSA